MRHNSLTLTPLEKQPKHEDVLHFLGPIHDGVEPLEFGGRRHLWQFRPSWPVWFARLTDLSLRPIASRVVEPGLPHDADDLGDDDGLLHFALPFCDPQ